MILLQKKITSKPRFMSHHFFVQALWQNFMMFYSLLCFTVPLHLLFEDIFVLVMCLFECFPILFVIFFTVQMLRKYRSIYLYHKEKFILFYTKYFPSNHTNHLFLLSAILRREPKVRRYGFQNEQRTTLWIKTFPTASS